MNVAFENGDSMTDSGGISAFSPLCAADVDPSRLFFTAVNVSKQKGLLDAEDLRYVDARIEILLSDALKASRKSYVKRDTAKELLEGVFRLVDGIYNASKPMEIVHDIKGRALEAQLEKAVKDGAGLLEKMRKRVYHLEHIDKKYPGLCLDFVSAIKSELCYTDPYRLGGGQTATLQNVVGLATPAGLSALSQEFDFFCGLVELMCVIDPKQVEAAAQNVGAMRAGEIKYGMRFVTVLTLSALYSGFYRSDSPFIPFAKIVDIEDDIFDLSQNELSVLYTDLINIFINRHRRDIDEGEFESSKTELERLYAFCVREGDISKGFIAQKLASFVKDNCKTKKDVRKILLFC